jgi:DNA-binding response OmpR family regulator
LHSALRLPDRRPRALIADSDQRTRLLISRHLLSEGFAIGECGDGRDALEHVTTSRFDLIVLDGTLPGLDGIALCRAIRQGSANPQSAIVIVAHSPAESDKVLALVNGADDYLTKPLSIREFLARVSAVMRRAQRTAGRSAQGPIDRADIRLEPAKRQVFVRGRAVACSKQEFDLLYALASSPGIVFSRQELLERYWPAFAATPLRRGEPDSATPPLRRVTPEAAAAPIRQGRANASIRLVDPIISRLRRKIEREADAPQLIITVWGIGYKFVE